MPSRYCCLCLLLMCLATPLLAADGPPPVFYVYMYEGDAGDYDLVEINPQADTLTPILSVTGERPILPTTIEAFSSLEGLAFQRELPQIVPPEQQAAVIEAMSAPGLATGIQSVRQDADGNFIIERQSSKCFGTEAQADTPPLTYCYGGLVFSLLDTATQQERTLWSLPFHGGEKEVLGGCYTTTLYENTSGHETIDQVLLHPTRPLMVVRVWSFGGCSHKAFLIDYATEGVSVQEVADATAIAWSPDGTEMAYVQGCTYGTLDLTTFVQTPLATAPSATCEDLWIAWPAPDTLILAKAVQTEAAYQQTLVWHTRSTGAEETLDLPPGSRLFYALTVRDEETGVVLAVGDSGIGYMAHPNVALDATPGVFLAQDFATPAEGRSANTAYVFGEGGFLDADLTLHTVDLEPYRERYGAARAALAMVGVEQPS